MDLNQGEMSFSKETTIQTNESTMNSNDNISVGGKMGEVSGKMGGKLSGKIGGKVSGKMGEASGKMGSKLSGKIGGKVSGKMGGEYSGKIGKMSSEYSGKMGGKFSGKMGGEYSGKIGGKMSSEYSGKMGGKFSGKMGGKFGKFSSKIGSKFSGKIGKRLPDDDFEISVELDKLIQEAETLSAAGVGGKIDAQTYHDSVNNIDETPFELTSPSEKEKTEDLDNLIKEVESLPLDNAIVSSLTNSLSEICELEAKKALVTSKGKSVTSTNEPKVIVRGKGKTVVRKALDTYELRIEPIGSFHVGKGYLNLLDKLESSEVLESSAEKKTPDEANDGAKSTAKSSASERKGEPKIKTKIKKPSPEKPVKQVIPKFDTSVQHNFKCSNCSHSYPEQRQLDFHLLMIHGIKKYQCYKCNYETSSKRWLETHLLEDHLKRQVFRCSMCKLSVPNLEFLEAHLKQVHKIKKVYKCLVCCKIFKTLSALVNHENFIHKAKGFAPKSDPKFITFPCHKCKKVFTREGNLVAHLRSHKRRIRLKCEFKECKQLRFYSKLTYIKHVKEIHKSKACRNCLKALKSNALFVYHLSVDSECFQYYESISNPGAKKKSKDKNTINDDEAEYNDLLKNMPFIPKLSELEQTVQQIGYDNEFLKSIGEDAEITETEIIKKTTPFKIEELKCNECNIKFREELTFGKHMTLVHNNLECYRCSKKFDTKEKILEHINVHYLDVKYDYRCKKCSKCFRYRSNLTLHETQNDCTKPKVKPVVLPPVTGVHKGHLFHGPPSLCL